MSVREALSRLVAGEALSVAGADTLFEAILAGQADDAQIGAVLALMQRRGVTVDEVQGAAAAMRRHVTPVPTAGLTGRLIDTCGTGGARKTINVSTLAAIVGAAAGQGRVLVAKHGNRGRSGRGSAEVLRALGVNVDAPPAVQARCLGAAGVCFCFAIHHHPAMRYAARARQSLGFPTIFNVVGPLTNPAGARRQVMGVFHPDLVGIVAEVHARLGAEHAFVVHGRDGIDEVSTAAPTLVAEVTAAGVRESEFDAAALGVARATPEQLDASDLDHAVRLARDIVLVNAALALVAAGEAADWGAGLGLAAKAVDSGAAQRTLEDLVRLSNGA
jgi:anthranilate phosphoribosyltransferase